MIINIRLGLQGLSCLFLSENVIRKSVRTKKCHGTFGSWLDGLHAESEKWFQVLSAQKKIFQWQNKMLDVYKCDLILGVTEHL